MVVNGKGPHQGFTITELLVAMTIATIVMAAIYSAYYSQQKAYRVTETVTEAQQNLRAAMYSFERDIRMAGFDPKGSKAFGFTNMGAASVALTWDSNENGAYESGTSEYISYTLASGQLLKQEGTAGGLNPTAQDITSVSLRYLDANGAVTSTASAVRTVEVTLTAGLGGHTRQLSTRIQCRNLGL